jgi:RNA polymerase sigma-70 factor, ECF subfamily
VSTTCAEKFDRDLLIQQIDACLLTVASGPNSVRDRRIFWLYYRVGLAASAIAALPTIGLSTKGVESTLLRLTRQIRGHLVQQTLQRTGTGESAEGIQPLESL